MTIDNNSELWRMRILLWKIGYGNMGIQLVFFCFFLCGDRYDKISSLFHNNWFLSSDQNTFLPVENWNPRAQYSVLVI